MIQRGPYGSAYGSAYGERYSGNNGPQLPLALRLRTQADWEAATGITLSNLWLCEDASTQMTDEIGGAHLAASSSPTYRQPGPWPGVVGVGTAAGQFIAASNTVLDHTTESFMHAALVAYEAGSAQTQQRGPFGKKANAGTGAGWRSYLSSTGGGSPGGNVADGSVQAFASTGNTFENEEPFWWVLLCQRGSTQLLVARDPTGHAQAGCTSVTTCTSTSLFSVGKADDTAGFIDQIHYRHIHASGSQLDNLDHAALMAVLTQGM